MGNTWEIQKTLKILIPSKYVRSKQKITTLSSGVTYVCVCNTMTTVA